MGNRYPICVIFRQKMGEEKRFLVDYVGNCLVQWIKIGIATCQPVVLLFSKPTELLGSLIRPVRSQS